MHIDNDQNATRIGLFGTVGRMWRTPFVDAYRRGGIDFYNPQVEQWNPALAEIEAKHLATDRIVVYVLTSESYGIAGLMEIGIAAAQVKGTDRHLLVYVEPDLDIDHDEPVALKGCQNARRLLMAHMNELRLSNVRLIDSLESLLDESIRLARELRSRD